MEQNPFEPPREQPIVTRRQLQHHSDLPLFVAIVGLVAMIAACAMHAAVSRLPKEQWIFSFGPVLLLLCLQSSSAVLVRLQSARTKSLANPQMTPDESAWRWVHLASLLPVLLLLMDAIITFVNFGTSWSTEGQMLATIRGAAGAVISLTWLAAFPFCIFVMFKNRIWRVPFPRFLLHCSAFATVAYPVIYLALMWLRVQLTMTKT